MQETLVWFLSQEDPLEVGQAAHSSIPELSWWLFAGGSIIYKETIANFIL